MCPRKVIVFYFYYWLVNVKSIYTFKTVNLSIITIKLKLILRTLNDKSHSIKKYFMD